MSDLTELRGSVAATLQRAHAWTGVDEPPAPGRVRSASARPEHAVRKTTAQVLDDQRRACEALQREVSTVRRERRGVEVQTKNAKLRLASLHEELAIAATAIQLAQRRHKELQRRLKSRERDLHEALAQRSQAAHAMLETEELFERISQRLRNRCE